MINEAHIKHLVDAMIQDKLIIFVGAGVSKNSNLPDWDGLVNEFKTELGLENEVDKLKIPQYYYDAYGQQKYLEKITSIFDEYETVKPNEIHDEIYKLNPKHLITTNYDTLIEDRMNTYFSKYEVIKKDTDIPYSLSGNYIIKMHGDVNEKNFVLKEDDYLDYEQNFQMISALIKSLIMSNTILFIGYSLGDPSFNSIFHMIKRYYGNNARIAYYFTPNQISDVEIEYYKKKGIQVVSNFDVNNPTAHPGDKTVSFLREITSQTSPDFNSEEGIWNQIKMFNKLAFFEVKDLIKNIETYGNAELDFIHKRSINWKGKEERKFKISKEGPLITFLTLKTNTEKFLGVNTGNEFKYKPNPVLNEAYEMYLEGNYSESLKVFRDIANDAFENKDYITFIIAGFNINQLERLVRWSVRYTDDLKDYKMFFEKEDFTSVINNIYEGVDHPTKKLITYLNNNVFNFKHLQDKLFSVNQTYNKIKKERYLSNTPGFSHNSNLYNMYKEIEDFNNFIRLNCLCVIHYTDYKSIINIFFESLLMAYDINENSSEEFEGSSVIEGFDLELIKMILPFIDVKMLPVYFGNLDLKKIKVTDETFQYLTNELVTISEKEDRLIDKDYEKLKTILVFLQYIEISDYNVLLDLFSKLEIYHRVFKEFRWLTVILVNNFDKLDKERKKKIASIVNTHLEIIEENNLDFHKRNYRNYQFLMRKFSQTFTDKNYYLTNNKIEKHINLVKSGYYELQDILEVEDYIINFFDFLKEKVQDDILYIVKQYEKLPNDNLNINFIVSIINSGIYDFQELKFFIKERLSKRASTSQEGKLNFSGSQKRALGYLFELYMEGYFTKNEILEELEINNVKSTLPIFDWVILDNYTLDIFDKIVKEYGLATIEENFVENDTQRKVLNEWKDLEIKKKYR